MNKLWRIDTAFFVFVDYRNKCKLTKGRERLALKKKKSINFCFIDISKDLVKFILPFPVKTNTFKSEEESFPNFVVLIYSGWLVRHLR